MNSVKHDEIFAEVFALTKSPSKAMLASEPALADRPNYAKVKAQRMMKKPDIKDKIDKKLQQMSKLAIEQLPKLITSDNETIATTNVWKTIEHNIGTPVKRNINMNANLNIEDALFND